MPLVIDEESQENLDVQIQKSFQDLSELLQDNAMAYKLCYEINKKYIEYSCNARMLLNQKPKQVIIQ